MARTFDPFVELSRVAANRPQLRTSPRFMPVDVYRDGDRYVLNADLPGVDPASVDADVDNRVLTIRAQRTATKQEAAQWLSHERPTGAYLRRFALGDGVDAEQISARYENGVLSVVIPVSEKAKPRKIQIVAGETTSPQAQDEVATDAVDAPAAA